MWQDTCLLRAAPRAGICSPPGQAAGAWPENRARQGPVGCCGAPAGRGGAARGPERPHWRYRLPAVTCRGPALLSMSRAGGMPRSGTSQDRKQSRQRANPGPGDQCSCAGWSQAGSTVFASARLVNVSCSGGFCLGPSGAPGWGTT